MNKYSALAAGLLIGGATLSAMAAVTTASSGSIALRQTPITRRGDLVHAIVMKWGGATREFTRTDVRTWARLMGPVFNSASLSKLQKAADAKTFQSMNTALVGLPPPSVLGSTQDDLVYVPITPCRIIDTRHYQPGNVSTPIAANTSRDFDVTSTGDYSAQGGSATDCNGAGSAEEFPAAVINFTTVNPIGAGYITAWPQGSAQPLAATVNYGGGDIRGNLSVVQLNNGPSVPLELSIYTLKTTQVVADIVGYFIRPQATALDCVYAAEFTPAGNFGGVFPNACDAGYTQTGIECWTDDNRPSAGSHDGECVWPLGTTNTIFHAKNRCCRTPGR